MPMHLLMALVMVAGQGAGPEPCPSLYEQTVTIRQEMIRQIRRTGTPTEETLQRSAEAARRARRCYSGRISDTTATLYQRELYALRQLRRYPEALAVADQFLKRFENTERPRQIAFVYQRQGRIYVAQERFRDAQQAYSRALTFNDALPVWRRAEVREDLAHIYTRLSDYKAARAQYQRAERGLRTASLTNSNVARRLARVLSNQANLTLRRASLSGRYDSTRLVQAAQQALEAASLYERTGQLDNLGIAYIKASGSYAYANRMDAAEQYMQRAKRLSEQAGSLPLRSATAYKMGRLRVKQDRLQEADVLLKRAMRLARQRGDLNYQRRIAIDRGALREMQQRWTDALRWYRRAAGLTERYRASLGLMQWSRRALGNWYAQQPYRGQVRVLLQQGKPQAAFRLLEQNRGRHLRTLRRRARITKTLPPAQHNRLDSLRSALAATRDSLARLPAQASRQNALQAREVRLMTAFDSTLELPPDTSVFSMKATQQALAPRNRVLLSYFLDEGSGFFERSPTSYLFALTADTLRTVTLDGSADSVRTLINDVSSALRGDMPRSRNDVQFNLNDLHQLYQVLLAPADSLLPQGAPLIIIPDGPLYSLPFGSLTTRPSAPFAYRNAPYLLRKHPVTTEGSAALVAPASRGRSVPYDVVAFGKSDFAMNASEGRAVFRQGDSLTLRTGALGDLPSVPRELDALSNLFAHVFTALGKEATETAFYDHMRQGRILHLASHTVVHPSAPLYNAVVLSEDKERREDGIVHLHELQRRALAAPLVVLSGCSTARGPVRTGEGMAGLEYGFRAMGAESLLATLWLVEDDAIAQLMQGFYRHLRDGQPKDEALRQAQLAYLRNAKPGRASPFFWAAPVLYGQARALALAPRRHGFAGKWTIGGLAFLLVLGLLWWRRRRAERRRNLLNHGS